MGSPGVNSCTTITVEAMAAATDPMEGDDCVEDDDDDTNMVVVVCVWYCMVLLEGDTPQHCLAPKQHKCGGCHYFKESVHEYLDMLRNH